MEAQELRRKFLALPDEIVQLIAEWNENGWPESGKSWRLGHLPGNAVFDAFTSLAICGASLLGYRDQDASLEVWLDHLRSQLHQSRFGENFDVRQASVGLCDELIAFYEKPFFSRFSSDDPHYRTLIGVSRLHEAVARSNSQPEPSTPELTNRWIEWYDKAAEPCLDFVTDLSSAEKVAADLTLYANGCYEILARENAFPNIEHQNEFWQRLIRRSEHWKAEAYKKGRTCLESTFTQSDLLPEHPLHKNTNLRSIVTRNLRTLQDEVGKALSLKEMVCFFDSRNHKISTHAIRSHISTGASGRCPDDVCLQIYAELYSRELKREIKIDWIKTIHC
jgi:hypothetical protein